MFANILCIPEVFCGKAISLSTDGGRRLLESLQNRLPCVCELFSVYAAVVRPIPLVWRLGQTGHRNENVVSSIPDRRKQLLVHS